MCSVCTVSPYRPCSLHSLCNLCTGCIGHAVCIGYRPYSLYGPYSVYHLCDPVLRPRMSAPWSAQSCDNRIDIFTLSLGHTNFCTLRTLYRLHRQHGLYTDCTGHTDCTDYTDSTDYTDYTHCTDCIIHVQSVLTNNTDSAPSLLQ